MFASLAQTLARWRCKSMASGLRSLRRLIMMLVLVLGFPAGAASQDPNDSIPEQSFSMPPRTAAPAAPGQSGVVAYVDTHSHLVETIRDSCSFTVALTEAIEVMERNAIAMSFVMPAPNPRETCDAREFSAAAAER